MSVQLKTTKMLWGRAAGRCAYPGCNMDLFYDEDDADNPSHVGEECHIVARSKKGPRGNNSMPDSERDSYYNLILLCRNHHKIIDDSSNGEANYSVDFLHEMKTQHEVKVRKSGLVDIERQRDDEDYAAVMEKVQTTMDFEKWDEWSSWLLAADQPQLFYDVLEKWLEAEKYIATRIFSGRYDLLEEAFFNFVKVLNDLRLSFTSRLEDKDKSPGRYITRKFYKDFPYDEKRTPKAHREYEEHVDLVMELTSELTKAANLLILRYKNTVDRSFRSDSGYLMITYGADMSFRTSTAIPLYFNDVASEKRPYVGSILEAKVQEYLSFPKF